MAQRFRTLSLDGTFTARELVEQFTSMVAGSQYLFPPNDERVVNVSLSLTVTEGKADPEPPVQPERYYDDEGYYIGDTYFYDEG